MHCQRPWMEPALERISAARLSCPPVNVRDGSGVTTPRPRADTRGRSGMGWAGLCRTPSATPQLQSRLVPERFTAFSVPAAEDATQGRTGLDDHFGLAQAVIYGPALPHARREAVGETHAASERRTPIRLGLSDGPTAVEIVCRRRIGIAHTLGRGTRHDGKEGLIAGQAHALAAARRTPRHVRAVNTSVPVRGAQVGSRPITPPTPPTTAR